MLMLRELRKEKGITQLQLSKDSGVPKRTIEDAEARGDLRISTAYKLAKAMKVSLSEMWIEESE